MEHLFLALNLQSIELMIIYSLLPNPNLKEKTNQYHHFTTS